MWLPSIRGSANRRACFPSPFLSAYVHGLAFPKDISLERRILLRLNPALMRYNSVTGAPRNLCLCFGVASHRSELGFIVLTPIIAAIPGLWATMRTNDPAHPGGVLGRSPGLCWS